MAGVEEEVTSSEPAEDLWNIAITTKDVSSNNVPQKSSNEILTELFGAFNAEPPKSLVASEDGSENDFKTKKHKKKHKKDKKHKKKSRSKRRGGEQDNSSAGNSSESDTEHEKPKERKHKHKKKHRSKTSDIDSSEEQKHKKRARHSKSPSEVKKEKTSDTTTETSKGVISESVVIKKEPDTNGNSDEGNDEVTSSTTAPCRSPPPPLAIKKDIPEDSSVFENVQLPEIGEDKLDKSKPAVGKIVIKDLKFSSVYEATVKEVEEQAKAKAEKYEEGELSDSSSPKTSDLSDDPLDAPSLGSEGGEAIQSSSKSDDHSKKLKRSHNNEKGSSHHRKSRHRSRSKSRSRSRDHDHKSRDKDRHSKHRDRDKEKERDRNKDREKERDKDRHKDRDRSRDKERDKERGKDRDRKEKERRRGHSRSRSRSPRSSRNRSSSRNRRRHSRDRRHSRSRSRDRKRTSGSDHIDKKKLLEIARRNAMNMLQAGILPGIMGKASAPAQSAAVPEGKPEKSAAKTVDELTEYCKELSKRENMGELSSLSGSEDSDSEKPFHHPFQVKDRPSFISLNIKNAVQLPLKSALERNMDHSQLRIQFPVSSGQQHRKTEGEWVPVTPPSKTEEKTKKHIPNAIEAPKPTEPTSSLANQVIDIGTLVSERLSALRKKHDSEQVQYADHMYGWKNVLPGQYTGDTGLRLLTPQQLASGAQAWARKDQLQTAAPVRTGMGMTLLQKMGWRPGEGLGKNKEGCQEPLQLEVKMDRKGLVAAEEIRARRPPPMVSQPKQAKANPVTLEGKHPVSLLTEYCSKRHYGAPHFDLCHESGPDHKKDFLFKVRVNGTEYTPSTASPNKKQAKAEAATVCLKALGVLLS